MKTSVLRETTTTMQESIDFAVGPPLAGHEISLTSLEFSEHSPIPITPFCYVLNLANTSRNSKQCFKSHANGTASVPNWILWRVCFLSGCCGRHARRANTNVISSVGMTGTCRGFGVVCVRNDSAQQLVLCSTFTRSQTSPCSFLLRSVLFSE